MQVREGLRKKRSLCFSRGEGSDDEPAWLAGRIWGERTTQSGPVRARVESPQSAEPRAFAVQRTRARSSSALLESRKIESAFVFGIF